MIPLFLPFIVILISFFLFRTSRANERGERRREKKNPKKWNERITKGVAIDRMRSGARTKTNINYFWQFSLPLNEVINYLWPLRQKTLNIQIVCCRKQIKTKQRNKKILEKRKGKKQQIHDDEHERDG